MIRWICIPVVLLSLSLKAQTGNFQAIDSLKALLSQNPSDTNRVAYMIQLATLYSSLNAEEGMKWAQAGLDLATEKGFTKLRSSAFNELGILNENKADFSTALECYFNSLKLDEELNDKNGKAGSLSNIGNVYLAAGDFLKAEEYYKRAKEINLETGNRQYLGINTVNLGLVYFNLRKIPEAIVEYDEAIRIFRELGDQTNEVIALINQAGVYDHQKEYEKALALCKQGQSISRMINNLFMDVTITSSIGELYMVISDHYNGASKKKYILDAIEAFQYSIMKSQEAGFLETLKSSYLKLSEAYTQIDKPVDALEQYKNYVMISDSIAQSETQLRIADLESRRELEIRDKQIEIDKLAVEKKRNERAYFYAGIVFLLGVIGFVIRSYVLQKRNNRLLSEEKQRSDNLLLNILPAETAEELKRNGTAKARRYDSASVLFTDFQNFTQFAESMSPEELVAEIDHCYRGFDRIVEQFNLEKIKTIGDAYMAAGGLPRPNETHPTDTVGAALAIREYIQDYSTERKASGKPWFEIRIGVHTGPVVTGIVGQKKFAYDLWGDTVNTAARMESSAEPGKVNISATTYDRIKDRFVCHPRGKIDAKNKGMLDMYYVESIKT